MNSRRWVALMLLLLGAASGRMPVVAQESRVPDGRYWLGVCSEQPALCIAYLRGFHDMQLQAGTLAIYCPQEGVNFDHMRLAILRYAKDYPDETHLAFANLARRALAKAYPCRPAGEWGNQR